MQKKFIPTEKNFCDLPIQVASFSPELLVPLELVRCLARYKNLYVNYARDTNDIHGYMYAYPIRGYLILYQV